MREVPSWTCRRAFNGALLLLTLLFAGCHRSRPEEPPTIAAAADLQFALEEIADRFRRDTGRTVRLSFGSSGNAARQIEQGAPFQLFLSADEAFVRLLAQSGRTLDEGTLYATGRIGIFVPAGSPLKADGTLQDLRAALEGARVQSFAIANPQHAPYGKRAQEALEKAGLWTAIRPRLVLGENVVQAAQFAVSGNAQGSIIAYSLASSPAFAGKGRFDLIPESFHQPLRQRMVLLRGAGATARAFHAYLQQPGARAILRRYGFLLPGERG
ncbi:molybdate ABC transporter substrate-binding protein [Geothrix sp. 21YS21S-2]|uniref:molybdate ABC transporter substrate-binding protein n=1 Tax=Geothrix sp. 21YS21S-2 TaxID=3068893 RepID=UPI0027B9F775|nr:molybdate ABC transporter substrate-binding protein [Geothrix sp. 21YS21S-2]